MTSPRGSPRSTWRKRSSSRVSFDLIYALPGQTRSRLAGRAATGRWRFGTGHLSLYQLTIEPGTRFATLAAKGDAAPAPTPIMPRASIELTQAMTGAAGLPAYEISNHARPGEESRHNLAYWRYQPYCGIGPGAHGRRGGIMIAAPQEARELARRAGSIAATASNEETALSADDRATEALLMGLRLAEGVDLAQIAGAERPADRIALIEPRSRGCTRARGPARTRRRPAARHAGGNAAARRDPQPRSFG